MSGQFLPTGNVAWTRLGVKIVGRFEAKGKKIETWFRSGNTFQIKYGYTEGCVRFLKISKLLAHSFRACKYLHNSMHIEEQYNSYCCFAKAADYLDAKPRAGGLLAEPQVGEGEEDCLVSVPRKN